jgi:uncharacterized membrane protein YvlD (DUF360 family)
MRLLLNWVLSAAAVWIVAQLGLGISVRGLGTALVAALVINALMLELASALLSPAFHVNGFLAAFIGAILLSLVNLLLKSIVMPSRDKQ